VCVCLSVCLSVCVSVCLSGYTFPHFSTNLHQIWREHSMGHDTYRGLLICCSALHERACVLNTCACLHSLIFERILFRSFAGNILRLTISVKDYILFMFTHCALTCQRACVIKHSRIYRPILFQFLFQLQITTSSMDYLLFIFAHVRACVCERACPSMR
jgi:hypothetical protein